MYISYLNLILAMTPVVSYNNVPLLQLSLFLALNLLSETPDPCLVTWSQSGPIRMGVQVSYLNLSSPCHMTPAESYANVNPLA